MAAVFRAPLSSRASGGYFPQHTREQATQTFIIILYIIDKINGVYLAGMLNFFILVEGNKVDK